jgi:tetratricopeptide (TPR) repeat protein
MKYFQLTFIFFLLFGGIDYTNLSSQDLIKETPLENEKNEENKNLEPPPSIEKTEDKIESQEDLVQKREEILKKAKIYQCQMDYGQVFKIAILDNGDAYLLFNDSFKKIPLEEGLNPEEIYVICKDQTLVLESKIPLSNLKHKQIFSFKNFELSLIGSSKQDNFNVYIDDLFQLVLEGNKNKILQLELKEIPFAYQYINTEKLSTFLDVLLQKISQKSNNRKLLVLESFGILTTKLINFYHKNLVEEKESLENYHKWIESWEYVGFENYENFILIYGKTMLNLNIEKGLEILKTLKEKKPFYIPVYIALGDYYWNQHQKEEAMEFYKQAIQIEENNKKIFLENHHFPSNIPEYVYSRINKEL